MATFHTDFRIKVPFGYFMIDGSTGNVVLQNDPYQSERTLSADAILLPAQQNRQKHLCTNTIQQWNVYNHPVNEIFANEVLPILTHFAQRYSWCVTLWHTFDGTNGIFEYFYRESFINVYHCLWSSRIPTCCIHLYIHITIETYRLKCRIEYKVWVSCADSPLRWTNNNRYTKHISLRCSLKIESYTRVFTICSG